MIKTPLVGAMHPAGIASAPDYMVRTLVREMGAEWDAATTAAEWIAAAADRGIRVSIDPRGWRTAPWTVTGHAGGPDPLGIGFQCSWKGFGAAHAARIIAALRAFGLLDEARVAHTAAAALRGGARRK